MAVVYYTQQDEYDLVNSGQDCIGWTAVDQAGNKIGEVTEMLISTDTEMIDSILIDNRKRIAAQDFALNNEKVVVRGIMHGGELEMNNSAEDGAAQSYEQTMPRRTDESRHIAGVTRAANDDEISIPIIEEQLRVGKRTVETGAAQVHTKVSEVPVQETVTLREENVTVERRPVDRAVENAPAAFQEGTIEVTEMAEVPVVSKQAHVVEEVVIGKKVTEHTETVSDTVKRTDVDVDKTDDINRTNNPDRQNG